MKTPPLRPLVIDCLRSRVNSVPAGRRLGSALKTQRASRAAASMIGREEGEAISSSLVVSIRSGAESPPHSAKAAATKASITSPAFMSATPGP
jgi:hypothetical protein